jgi:hypothetical protein
MLEVMVAMVVDIQVTFGFITTSYSFSKETCRM